MTCIPSNDSSALVKLIIDTVDDAVMRVGASANCYDVPADANSGAEYVAARVRSVVVGDCTRRAQGDPASLSSRDTEIREVLEGLMRTFSDERCWCGEGDYVHNDQDKACLAARALYAKLQPKEANDKQA